MPPTLGLDLGGPSRRARRRTAGRGGRRRPGRTRAAHLHVPRAGRARGPRARRAGAGAVRAGRSPGDRHRGGGGHDRPTAAAICDRSRPGSAPMGRCCRRSRWRSPRSCRRPVPGAARGRDPGDAAARDARAPRADGGGDPVGRGADGPREPRAGVAPSSTCSTSWPGAPAPVRDLSSPRVGRRCCAVCARSRRMGLVELTWTLTGGGRRAHATSGGYGSRPRAW